MFVIVAIAPSQVEDLTSWVRLVAALLTFGVALLTAAKRFKKFRRRRKKKAMDASKLAARPDQGLDRRSPTASDVG